MAAIENSDQKALIIALLLLSILAYVNRNYIGEGNLKNVILLEEVHVLLDSESTAGEGEADPRRLLKGYQKECWQKYAHMELVLLLQINHQEKYQTT